MANVQHFTPRDAVVSAFQYNGPNHAKLFEFCKESCKDGIQWGSRVDHGIMVIWFTDDSTSDHVEKEFTVNPGSFVYYEPEAVQFEVLSYQDFMAHFMPVRLQKD